MKNPKNAESNPSSKENLPPGLDDVIERGPTWKITARDMEYIIMTWWQEHKRLASENGKRRKSGTSAKF